MSTKPGSAPGRRPRQPCSTTSRSSTTGSVCTRPLAIAPRSRRGSAWKGLPSAQPRDVLISPLHSQGAGPNRFLRDYLYISLGGSRHVTGRRYGNLMATMLLGGLWHGAGWTFVLWGGLHGAYLVVNHLWRELKTRLGLCP